MAGQLDDKITALKDQVKKLQSQKDMLLKELDEVEERFNNQNRVYRKYFPVILDMVAVEETPFARACKELATAMRKKATPAKIDYIFQQMKTAMIKEDIGPVVLKKKKGLLSSFLRTSSDTFIDEFKLSYHELVNSLKSTLDRKYATELETLNSRILGTRDSNDINEIRESIFDLIFRYISETSQDREKVNAFIRDIVGKILEIETKLTSSFEHTRSLVSSNQGFESVLSLEMAGLKETSDMAASLDDLKTKITQGLTSIEKALRKKQQVDQAINKLAEKIEAHLKPVL